MIHSFAPKNLARFAAICCLSFAGTSVQAYVVTGGELAAPESRANSAGQSKLDEAYAALRASQFETAQKIFIEANRVKPTDYEPMLGLAMVAQAQGKPIHARDWMARAVSAAPTLTQHQLLQAQARLLQEQGLPEQAVDSYKKAIAGNPKSAQIRYDLASFYLDPLKRPAEAIVVLRELIARQPEMGSAHLLLAQALLAAGKPAEAVRGLDEAARLEPGNPKLPRVQGQLSMDQGRPEQALVYFDKALAVQSDSVESLMGRGNALAALGRNEEAVVAYQRAAATAPLNAAPHILRARLLERQKRLDGAEAAYRDALRADDGQPVAMNNLASLLAARKIKLDEAQQLASRVVQADPKQASYVDTLGEVQMARGDVAGARKSFEKAVALDPASKTFREHLARAEAAVGSLPLAARPAVQAAPAPVQAPVAAVQQAAPKSPVVVTPKALPEDPAKLLGPSLEAWRKAWESKDVAAYLAFYGRDFAPADKRSRTAWEAERRSKLGKPGEIAVSIQNPVFMHSGDVLTVVFDQGYKSANYQDAIRKQMEWVREDGAWRIRREAQR